jgi:hypothetical protein
MIIINKPTYRCEFCGKLYLQKHWCEKHEIKCKSNPINDQVCREGCVFLEQKEIIYLRDHPYAGDKQLKTTGMFCTKKEHYVYPYWCNNPILQEDIIDEILNEPMPKKCDKFKTGSLFH